MFSLTINEKEINIMLGNGYHQISKIKKEILNNSKSTLKQAFSYASGRNLTWYITFLESNLVIFGSFKFFNVFTY